MFLKFNIDKFHNLTNSDEKMEFFLSRFIKEWYFFFFHSNLCPKGILFALNHFKQIYPIITQLNICKLQNILQAHKSPVSK